MFVQLKHQAIKEVYFSFNPLDNNSIDLESNFDFSVSYSPENDRCIATLVNRVRAQENPDILDVSVRIVGNFALSGIDSLESKKAAHIRAYELLFPYSQSIIAELFMKAGMAPLMINMEQMNPNKVMFNENET